MSYSDKLERDRIKSEEGARRLITGDDPLAEILVALDAREISLALRKTVALKLAERVAADEVGSGDLVRLLGMINDRVDGKVSDRLEVAGDKDNPLIIMVLPSEDKEIINKYLTRPTEYLGDIEHDDNQPH